MPKLRTGIHHTASVLLASDLYTDTDTVTKAALCHLPQPQPAPGADVSCVEQGIDSL